MDDPPTASVSLIYLVLSALFDSIAFIARIPWTSIFAQVFSIVILPARLVASGLSRIASVLAVIFAPALYFFAFLLWASRIVYALVIGLEPLYKFFSVAVTIGIISGIILAVTSSFVTDCLGMHEEPDLKPETPPTVSPPLEYDWPWAEPSPPSKRRQPSGLLSQTIHEEDSDI
ncbi:hypothetical protein CP533_2694 [Ophiocordyceps camponoti-saundersi (nom. inval.)]|nr:hypothetical protein CP533_2694 [Ophiocordyceps camponoti-saundersi (nom. inval.)]